MSRMKEHLMSMEEFDDSGYDSWLEKQKQYDKWEKEDMEYQMAEMIEEDREFEKADKAGKEGAMSKMKEHMMSMMEVEFDDSGHDAWIKEQQKKDQESQMEDMSEKNDNWKNNRIRYNRETTRWEAIVDGKVVEKLEAAGDVCSLCKKYRECDYDSDRVHCGVLG